MAMLEAPNTGGSVTSEPYPVLTERLPRWCKATESRKHRSKNTLNFNGVKPEGPEGSCQTVCRHWGWRRTCLGCCNSEVGREDLKNISAIGLG